MSLKELVGKGVKALKIMHSDYLFAKRLASNIALTAKRELYSLEADFNQLDQGVNNLIDSLRIPGNLAYNAGVTIGTWDVWSSVYKDQFKRN